MRFTFRWLLNSRREIRYSPLACEKKARSAALSPTCSGKYTNLCTYYCKMERSVTFVGRNLCLFFRCLIIGSSSARVNGRFRSFQRLRHRTINICRTAYVVIFWSWDSMSALHALGTTGVHWALSDLLHPIGVRFRIGKHTPIRCKSSLGARWTLVVLNACSMAAHVTFDVQ